MLQSLSYYTKKFTNLRVSRSSGIAPNKPILLLSVIEMIAQEQITTNRIYLSGELIATFLNLWAYLATERKSDIGLPFYHLINDNFWHYKMKPGFDSLITAKVKVRTVSTISATVDYAYLDEELWAILQIPQARNILSNAIINLWFSDKRQKIEELLQVNAFAELQKELILQGGQVYTQEEVEDEQSRIVRDTAFRKIIINTYSHRCAFCGLQIIDNNEKNIVDGSHIKPFSQFYDDRIDNGLSLCKNHHWAFDRFWFTIDDDYTIIVSDTVREDSPNAKPISAFKGEQMILPARPQHYPRLDALQWHRQEFSNRNVPSQSAN